MVEKVLIPSFGPKHVNVHISSTYPKGETDRRIVKLRSMLRVNLIYCAIQYKVALSQGLHKLRVPLCTTSSVGYGNEFLLFVYKYQELKIFFTLNLTIPIKLCFSIASYRLTKQAIKFFLFAS